MYNNNNRVHVMDNNNFEEQFESSSNKIPTPTISSSPFKKIAKKQNIIRNIFNTLRRSREEKEECNKESSYITNRDVRGVRGMSKDKKPRTMESLDFLEEEMCAVSSKDKGKDITPSYSNNDYVITGSRSVQYHYQNSEMNSPRGNVSPRSRKTQSASSAQSPIPPPNKKTKRRLSM